MFTMLDNFQGNMGHIRPDGTQGGPLVNYGGGVERAFNGNMYFDVGLRRPYVDRNGNLAVTVSTGRWTVEKGMRVPIKEHRLVRDMVNNGMMSPGYVTNATALRKEEWLELDKVVLKAARYPLRAWADLEQANPYGGFNGMSKMILEHETMSDPGEAIVDMTGLTPGRRDAPQFQLEGLPLPITHCDFDFDSRRLAISRNSGSPLDTTMGEAAGRRVSESVEKVTIGVETGVTYGGNSTQVGGYGRTSSVYGYLNFSSRLTKTNVVAPTAAVWTPAKTQQDLNTCLNTLRNQKFFGPFILYHSNDWSTYLNDDYYVSITSGAVAPTKTLRERLLAVDGIQDIRRLDLLRSTAVGATDPINMKDATLRPFTWLIVQMTPDVARAVVGMSITTLQWETVGGMMLNFKVMGIMVPQLRADFYGNCGIMHATTA